MGGSKRISFHERLKNLHLHSHPDLPAPTHHVTTTKNHSGVAFLLKLGFFLGVCLLGYHGYTLWVKKEGDKKKWCVDSRNVFSYEGTSGVEESLA